MKRVAAICLWMLAGCFLSTPLAAQVQVRVATVVSAPIIEELPLAGSVLSPRYSDLSTRESGLVASLAVDAGDRVEQAESRSAPLSARVLLPLCVAFDLRVVSEPEGERFLGDVLRYLSNPVELLLG